MPYDRAARLCQTYTLVLSIDGALALTTPFPTVIREPFGPGVC